MSTRRQSLAPRASNPPLATASRASRRVSSVLMAPVKTGFVAKPAKRGRPKKAQENILPTPSKGRGRPKKQQSTGSIASEESDDFVTGDMFDFNALESPKVKGPMTRSRRSSIYVGVPLGGGITSTKRRAAVKSRLDAVMETPDQDSEDQEVSFVAKSIKKSAIINKQPKSQTPVASKKLTPIVAKKVTPASIKKSTPFRKATPVRPRNSTPYSSPTARHLANALKPSSVVISPLKKAALQRAFAAHATMVPSPQIKAPKLSMNLQSPKAGKSAGFPGTPQPADPANLLRKTLKRKVETQMDKENTHNVRKVTPGRPRKNAIKPSNVGMSPLKKAALQKAFAVHATKVSSPKKAPTQLKVNINKKLSFKMPRPKAGQSGGFPGTPTPADPANLLRKNLKRKVDTQLDNKVQEIPKNSSPYTILVGETENGSPVEHFVKVGQIGSAGQKSRTKFVTGTPAQKPRRILLSLNNQQQPQMEVAGSPHPVVLTPIMNRRRSARLTDTPVKAKSPRKVLYNSPNMETENVAVNKAAAKQSSCISPTKATSPQMMTGNLASMCLLM